MLGIKTRGDRKQTSPPGAGAGASLALAKEWWHGELWTVTVAVTHTVAAPEVCILVSVDLNSLNPWCN